MQITGIQGIWRITKGVLWNLNVCGGVSFFGCLFLSPRTPGASRVLEFWKKIDVPLVFRKGKQDDLPEC